MNIVKTRLLPILAVLVAFAANARAAVDLGPVEDELTALKTALLLSAAVVIGLAVAVFALKAGGKWLLKLWKAFAG